MGNICSNPNKTKFDHPKNSAAASKAPVANYDTLEFEKRMSVDE